MSFVRGISLGKQRLRLRSGGFQCFQKNIVETCELCESRYVIKVPFREIMRQIRVDIKPDPKGSEETYEEAVAKLNTLQSNAAYLAKTVAERDKRRHDQVPLTLQSANRLGITVDDLNKLSVIHVTGTKGKGSTCAFTESILRTHGYKTGFFSSPHLVEVRERIRVGGLPLSREAFVSYFWSCYRKLEASKEDYDGYMPPYFHFLTVMALDVFLKEKVDVAILEVGIGGEYDSTNIVRSPVVCGITSLGLDHISILGDTIEKIAWNKAGIFKRGVPAVTVQQPDNSMEVLQSRAHEKGCPLYIAPTSIHEYDHSKRELPLGIPGGKQDINASLATQLCNIWLQNHSKGLEERLSAYGQYANGEIPKADNIKAIKAFSLTDDMLTGLRDCYWPGRCQTINRPGITFYVDGAHTPRSIEACAEWYVEESRAEAKEIGGKVMKVLIFNATGDRKPDSLLSPLLVCKFDCAVFCPNIATTISGNKVDQTNFMVTKRTMLSKCMENQHRWQELSGKTCTQNSDTYSLPESNTENGTSKMDNSLNSGNNNGAQKSADFTQEDTESFGCILEGLHWVSQGRELALPSIPSDVGTSRALLEADHIQVLCTGSLHLVGGLLGIIEPTICDKLRK